MVTDEKIKEHAKEIKKICAQKLKVSKAKRAQESS